jgi:hypothetical protein
MYLREMQDYLYDQFGAEYDSSTIFRHLQRHELTHKVLERHAAEQNVTMRADFRHLLRPLSEGGIYSPEMLVFVDETHCDEITARRKFGWSKKGTTAWKATRNFQGGGDGRSAIATISMQGILTAHTYDVVNIETFMYELEVNILPTMSAFPAPRSVLILDNAAVHHKLRIHAKCNPLGVFVIFLPPYSYDYNPIEKAFHVAKSYLRDKYGNDNLENPIAERLCEALFTVTSDIAVNLFKNCFIEITPDSLIKANL